MLHPTQSELDELAVLFDAGRFHDAASRAETLASRYPTSSLIHNILGAAHRELGQLSEAAQAFETSAKLAPKNPDPLNNLGVVRLEQNRFADAEKTLRRVLRLAPNLSDAHVNLGNALKRQGQLGKAVKSYQRALSLSPKLFEAHYEMGVALLQMRHKSDAAEAFLRALSYDPNSAFAYSYLANISTSNKQYEDAVRYYRDALRLDPGYETAKVRLLQQLRYICDWRAPEFGEPIETLGTEEQPVPPFAALSLDDDPQRQFTRAKVYADRKFGHDAPTKIAHHESKDRIRIGYFGADFHDHATMYLMGGLLREHDTKKFEIFIFSYGHTKSGRWRDRAKAYASRFFDVSDKSDADVLDLARRKNLDVAIDLKGYTLESRSQLFLGRLAPVQVSFLGYPGTMAAPFMDYILADPTVVPENERASYTEHVIYMPHSYQPNDIERVIADEAGDRGDHGLPENGLVLCCFNDSYKISPIEFDIWMRVLGAVEDSVLWLLKSHDLAETNLRREAAARGVDPDRLVFADRMTHAEHLGRHRHADLFLDTFNYNAHTTASDALWGGVPVVAKAGRQFAARVSSSLLAAVGLPELITQTEAEYEALVLELAQDRERLAALKDKLARNRLTEPLFDTVRYTRDFEVGLEAAHKLRLAGSAPRDIWVGQLV